ncbi:hypothetical protein Shel_28290 [Slackia heliotrinireducens DSM 20476]|uniref:Uncharacterized protein n=1 Tax=Slackia heliotrinireducens (strain ATCC 29202 / DSM 20476 / NCTC 11029 / RHS 1) TaxID=471855 RepID=C7N483_SLAHD|nr:hypothetical protein Shel_28290 [Slackia heliotrinireducens DSM 20476]
MAAAVFLVAAIGTKSILLELLLLFLHLIYQAFCILFQVIKRLQYEHPFVIMLSRHRVEGAF